MRTTLRLAMIVCIVLVANLVVADMCAFAQCPPGTHWSNKYWQCMPNRRMPPPPPPPPPRGHGHGCNRSYQNCMMVCAGVPQCINNCNIGYNVCRQQRGW